MTTPTRTMPLSTADASKVGAHAHVPGIAATAPYNFVPYPERIILTPAADVPKHDRYHPDLLTGRIECVLTTETPTYVRCGWSPEEFREKQKQDALGSDRFNSLPPDQRKEKVLAQLKNKPDPFNHGDPEKPWIPGSTMRGYVRSVFQIVSFSRPDPPDERTLSARGIMDTALRDWYLNTSAGTPRFLAREGLTPGEEADFAAMGRSGVRPKGKFRSIVKAGYIRRRGNHYQIEHAGAFFRCGVRHANLLLARGADKNLTHTAEVSFIPTAPDSYCHGGENDGIGRRWSTLRLVYAKLADNQVDLLPSALADGGKNAQKGTLVCSGTPNKKHFQYVFSKPTTGAAVFDLDDSMVDELKQVMADSEQVKDANGAKAGPEPRDIFEADGEIKDGCPVFYVTTSKFLADGTTKTTVESFGWTQMYRLAYRSKFPDDFFPTYDTDPPDADLVDMTRAVFGWVGRNGQHKNRRGRVRVTSARLAPGQSQVLLETKTPKILGPPKPSCFQHYLTQENGPRLAHFGRRGSATFRGVKRYWPRPHSNDVPEALAADVEKAPKQHTQMRPVRSGLRFTFSIAFDNLRVEELGALLYALKPVAVDDTWDETAQPVVHTIGMGKPYGLGTVTIAPSLTIDQRYSETGSPGRYAKLFEGKRWFQPRIQGITQKDCVKAYLDAIGSKFAAGDLRAHPSLLALQKMTRAHGVNAEYIPLGLAWRSRRVLPSATDVG